jgi:hypothetical protein
MSPLLFVFAAALVVAQLILPRKYGFLPLIIAAAHLGDRELLPELTPVRMIILTGLAKAVCTGYFRDYRKTGLDIVFGIFSIVAVLASFGHKPDEYFPSPFAASVGLVLNVVGAYLYGRVYLPDLEAFVRYAYILPLVLIPLALGMMSEQATRANVYYALGARSPQALIREGKIRANGPFDHAILAGTCGATVLPFAYLLLRRGRKVRAAVAAATSMAIVMSCASSGPLAAVAVSIVAVVLWRWRMHMRIFMYFGIAFGAFYWIVKGRGPWFLMASLDLVGGSTGWHRAQLIDQSVNFLSEWWLCGTNYTRHWMASGVRWNPNMVDLTNYYIHLGVTGGLGLTLSLVAILVVSFRMLGRGMAVLREKGDPDEVVLWCAGAALAAHALSFVSISYFDQMYAFFYLLVGSIPGLVASALDSESDLTDRESEEAEASDREVDFGSVPTFHMAKLPLASASR